MAEKRNHLYRFGVFELDVGKRLLWRKGTLVPLAPKSAETLALLVEREGDVVEKQELLARVWPDTVVEENGLTQIISALRKALGPQPDGQQYIETVAKRGYRFVARTAQKVVEEDNSQLAPSSEAVAVAAPKYAQETEQDAAHYTFHFQVSRQRFWLWVMLFGATTVVMIGVFGHTFAKRSSGPQPPAADVPIIGIHPKWYDFEEGIEGWMSASSGMITELVSSDVHSYKGHRSLAITFNGAYEPKAQVYTLAPKIPPGDFVMAHIWCPRGNNLTSIALFVEEGNGSWDNDWESKSHIDFGSWTGFRMLLPTDAVTPIRRVGVEFTSHSAWSGTCYLDSVEWMPSW